MKRSFLFLVLALPLLAAQPSAAPAPASAGPVAELPVQTFFQAPTITSLTFSPNGKYIACLVPYEHRMNLAVIDLEKHTKNLITNFKDRQATAPFWANNDRILFRVDDDGMESFSLYGVNRDGSNPGILSSGYSKFGTMDEANARFNRVLRRLPNDPKNILVLANLTYRDRPDVALMNLKTGEMTKLVEAPGNTGGYVLDHDNRVRICAVQDHGVTKVLHRSGGPKSDWEVLTTHDKKAPGWMPVAFAENNDTLLVAGRFGGDRAVIRRYDLKTRQLGEIVCQDDIYDTTTEASDYNPYPLSDAIFDPVKRQTVGFAYRTEKAKVVWFDEEFARLQKQIDASLPDTANFLLTASPDGSKLLIIAQSDRDPGVYYLFDREKKKIEELAVRIPGIDPDKMAPMKPITFTSRDGLTIHGYLTLPVGRPAKNLPLIMHPHGGPYGIRDDWVFNAEVQYYANRGYAVIQVDYRGSGGYGRKFEKTGYHKWGLEMQNDLTDAVKWVIAQGIADPERVVISGASYGGYATMAGLTFTPELYCAGINYVGVTNLSTQWGKYKGTDDQLSQVHELFGDMDKAADRKRAYDTSPCNFADRIRVPVLMAYGKNDPRVNIDQGYDMESALKKAGKTYEMVIEGDEGHGFRKEEKRIAFFTKVDEFLNRYVGTKAKVKVGPTEVIDMPAKAGGK
ncbi:MAG: S9 family peptidase [Verrucomicrobia bacterium]|nr:S9 family peptidase [Verrucomicrobiota bacterium]